MNRHVRKLATMLALVTLAASTSAPPTLAAKPVPSDAMDFAAVDLRIDELTADGASQAQIDRILEREFGWVRVTSVAEPTITPMTTQLNAKLLNPYVYKINSTGIWTALSRFSWNHNCGIFGNTECWYQDCYRQGDCGGPDGFAVRTNRALNHRTTAFYTYDEYGGQTTWSGPDERNAYGASWVTTDRLNGSQFPSGIGEKYNWDHGSMYWTFNPVTCTGKRGVAWKFYSRLYHTWNTTTISGVSVSATGFGVSVSGGSSYWPLSNPSDVSVYLCGQ